MSDGGKEEGEGHAGFVQRVLANVCLSTSIRLFSSSGAAARLVLWLQKENRSESAALLWTEKPKGTSRIVLASEGHSQQRREDQARVFPLN